MTELSSTPSALLREINEYEQRLGDLLANLEEKDYEIRLLQTQKKDAERRLMNLSITKEAQAKNQDRLIEALALNAIQEVSKRVSVGNQLLTNRIERKLDSYYSEDRATESLQVIAYSPAIEPTALRANINVSNRKGDSPVYRVTEKPQAGVHSIVFKFPALEVDLYRGTSVKLRSAGAPAVRVRTRLSADIKTCLDFSVCLQTGKTKHFSPRRAILPRFVEARLGQDGWIDVSFRGAFLEDMRGIDIEVISLPSFDSVPSASDGDPKRSFEVTAPAVSYCDGIVPTADASGQEGADKTSPIGADDRKELRSIRTRHTAHLEYLASPEYRRVASLRGIHKGRRAFIVGNGPSIATQDLTKLSNEITFSTNWFTNHPQFDDIKIDYLCVSSHEMFGGWNHPDPRLNATWLESLNRHHHNPKKFFSYRFSQYIRRENLFAEDEVFYLLYDRPKVQIDEQKDINLDLSGHMHDGYTGVLTFCVPLAVHMGITDIYLVGCDCDYGITPSSNEKKYFYDYSLHASSTTKTDSLLRHWADAGPAFQSYEITARRLEQEGVRFVNATAGGRLDVLPRVTYESLF